MNNKRIIFIFILSLIFSNLLYSGEKPKNESFKDKFLNINRENILSKEIFTLSEQKKSPFIAVCLSIILPGLGEYYSNRFDVGKYSMSTEAGLWVLLTGANIYSYNMRNDGRSFARSHAGFDDNNKGDDYYINVSNYLNIYDFNDKRLRERDYKKIYDPNSNMSWQWDSDENRKKFRDIRIKSDEILNNLKYISLALITNRIISAINAARFTNQFNKSIEGLSFSLELTKNNEKYDGFILNFSANF